MIDLTSLAKKKILNDRQLMALADTLTDVFSGQFIRVMKEGPINVIRDIVKDSLVAALGPNPSINDPVTFAKDLTAMATDVAMNVFNALPSIKSAPTFSELAGNINVQANKVIVDTTFHSEASIGDLSWLIYKAKMVTNTEITDKWKLVSEVETLHAYNSRTYVDQANKQVVITLEGTQPNTKLSPLWLSKDGLADLEIGLGIIPAQFREGYQEFKTMVADATNKYVANGYGISIAGHSLGGGLAQMMSGMYFIDTGVALPTIAEAGPGMLRQLQIYAEEQLLAGNTIHLPTGGTYDLHSLTILGRAEEAKALVSTFKAQDFSNVVNLITDKDPVGHVNYNVDPGKDGHVGVNMIVPYLLTAREDLQDVQYTAALPANSLNITTPSGLPNDPLGLLSGLGNISATRFDRHEPDQSDVLWGGTAVGLKDLSGDIGAGSAVFRDFLEPRKVWTGSTLGIAEVKIIGDSYNNLIDASPKVSGSKNAFVLAGDGNDTVKGSNNGDFLSGGNGQDNITGGTGDDYIAGDAGHDKLYGGKGQDILYGGDGDDTLDGGLGDDILCGGAGNDILTWSGGSDILMGNEGNDTYIINSGVSGNTQIKWERNFTNFGNDVVNIKGAMNSGSSLLFNFADEIRFEDMRWSQQGNDIIMKDNEGNAAASVIFKDAVTGFAQNSGQIDFQFTNGRLYLDDVGYQVRAGAGTITATDNEKYKGSILVGSAGNDTLVGGSGNDLLFGGAGADTFVFTNNFGHDVIASYNSQDQISFNTAFNATQFTTKKDGNDLIIGYQQQGLSAINELTVSNWFTTSDKVNDFIFGDGSHCKIVNNSFCKI